MMYIYKLFVGLSCVRPRRLFTSSPLYDKKLMNKLNYKTIKGAEFKRKFPKYQAMKFIGNNFKNFAYKIGINSNSEPFNPSGACIGKGLYFVDESEIFNYCVTYGDKIAIIKLLDNEDIYVEDDKCKTNSFEITEITEIAEYFKRLTPDKKLSTVKNHTFLLLYLKKKDDQEYKNIFIMGGKSFQIDIVKQNGLAIQYIPNPDFNVQMEAVKQNGLAIQYIPNPDNNIRLEAVKQNGLGIKYIPNPDTDVQMVAIKQNWRAIQYILNPDLDVQMEAIEQDGLAILYITNPDWMFNWKPSN